MSQQSGTANPNGSTFSPNDLHAGVPFDYFNAGRTTSGCVGKVCSHDNGSVHVIHDCTGNAVCAITGNAPKVVSGDTVFVTAAGKGTIFAFHPQA